MNIKELRLAKNLTQVKLAILVGVSPQTIRMWEEGAISPNASNEEKLKEVLGVE